MNNTILDHIELTTGKAPQYTVIWLHGLGADGHDFEPIVPMLGLPADPAIRFVFPHAPHRPVTINGGMVMRAWYDVSALDFVSEEDATGIEQSAESIVKLIGREAASGIPPERIVLAGFSQGGAIVLHAGLRHPQPLAGIVALSTYLPLAARLPYEAHSANRGTPIFMGHGSFDPLLPVTLGEHSRDYLTRFGYRVEWHAYPMEHAVHLDEIRDIGVWLSARFRAAPQASGT